MINIALPKGRLGDKVFSLLSSVGYDCESLHEDNRKLIFESPENNVCYQLIKPSDVGIYVERGVCDIGIVGKDVLLETNPDIYELLDLKLGKCRMAACAKVDYVEDKENILRVGTKYPHISSDYYSKKNREIEIIKLNGSVELAAVTGLADVIVDIVETGSTLKENNLAVYETIVPISARLIANKSSYKFKNEEITKLQKKLADIVADKD